VLEVDMVEREPAPGATHRFDYQVGDADTAAALSAITGQPYPRVLATTRCIALLELAAGALLAPLQGPHELSVGVVVDVTHLAATPVGAQVTAEATYRCQEGKLYVFEVIARDGGGEIMRGTHKRAIIEDARLLASAARRNPQP
jgi:fluoroacetyl-CoA thioesterase